MAFKMDTSQQKIAERLVILNDRAAGMLTRLYNIKKTGSDLKSRPKILSDKSMEKAIKHIVNKFPIVDTKSNTSLFSNVSSSKEDITKSLMLYYYTLADLMDLKDNMMKLMTDMDACQCKLNIAVNYELTAGYLNLVVNLVSLMIVLSRIEDRKIVLGLFNAAYDIQHGQSEASFPRLSHMILDYEFPLKKLHEDLTPLNRLIFGALLSLEPVYMRRNLTAQDWKKAQILSLTVNPQQILYAAQTDTIACEYLSLDVMDRWVIFCGTICYSTILNDEKVHTMWKLALQTGICLRVFRDEIFSTHTEVQHFLDSIKGNQKKTQDVKDCYSVALQLSAGLHAERRRYLRCALRELLFFIKDQPGLLGPKILFVWMALCFSRDEVLWLLRHINEWPTSKKGNKLNNELVDRQLPELLHYMLELRDMVVKHSDVIQRYYASYVSSYDSIVISELVQKLQGLNGEHESTLLNDFAHSIGNMCSDTDLRALRLDWFRFQALTSVARGGFLLENNPNLAISMSRTVFHLKQIDLQDEMLRETSDLSIYCFYSKALDRQFHACLQVPVQSRFVLSFARMASHFTTALHDLCPEEHAIVIERALNVCNTVVEGAATMICDIMSVLSENELRWSEQTSPSAAAAHFISQIQISNGTKGTTAAMNAAKNYGIAGTESHQVDRCVPTLADKYHASLSELCAALSEHREILVNDYVFSPRAFLLHIIEDRFVNLLHGSLFYEVVSKENKEKETVKLVRRPSDLLLAMKAYMNVIQNIDSAVSIDVHEVFKKALLNQTPVDSQQQRETLAAVYTKWYLEVILRRASMGTMVWSEHLRSMLPTRSGDEETIYQPELYTDPHELRALVQLIGPYGIKYMTERLIWHVSSQIKEINKIVLAHREPLTVARSNFDNSDKMKEVLAILCADPKDKKATTCAADAILQRTIIIGEICHFRDALYQALRQVIEIRLPFMVDSFDIMFDNLGMSYKVAFGELSAAMGVCGPVDVALVNAMRAQFVKDKISPDEQYNISCLLLVAIAICLPRIALNESSIYRPSLRVSDNNSHCVPIAVNTITAALFALHKNRDTVPRMKEFLALASSSVLHTVQECEGKEGKEEAMKTQNTLHIILEQLVRKNNFLTMDVLEACFPYNLVRSAYLQCYEDDRESH